VFPLNLYAHVRFLLMHIAHETAGAARTRSSLRPLRFGGGTKLKDSDKILSRERGLTSRRPCARRDPYGAESRIGNEVDAFFSD
jgi:hypothetical protein